MKNLDSELLLQLYERYWNEIYLYIFSLCHSHSLAEDILQETFMKAILSLPNNHANMRAWLYMVARNLCFNCMKKERNVLLTNQIQDVIDRKQLQEDLIQILLKKEEKRFLYEALSKLSVPKKEILLLQYFCTLSQKEIAAILHITPENVRVLSYRAKKELKSYLEANGYEIS